MFVRQVADQPAAPAFLVIDQAITSIQGRKNLTTFDDKDTVQELPVTLANFRATACGWSGKRLTTRRVVVSKLLQVRPKTQIQPVLQPMPTYSARCPPAGAQEGAPE
jgi:hypothetical protein